jgi:putative oxidoreductase
MKKYLFTDESFRRDTGLLLLRVSAGAIMLLAHGWPKLLRALGENPSFFSLAGLGPELSLWLAIFAEVGCSLLLIFGFFTRPALLPLIFTMGVAAFVAHAGDPWGRKEAAVVFLLIYAALFFTGPGRFSADAQRR